jgi:hypothetical protein
MVLAGGEMALAGWSNGRVPSLAGFGLPPHRHAEQKVVELPQGVGETNLRNLNAMGPPQPLRWTGMLNGRPTLQHPRPRKPCGG